MGGGGGRDGDGGRDEAADGAEGGGHKEMVMVCIRGLDSPA